jgi:hypothetical protein
MHKMTQMIPQLFAFRDSRRPDRLILGLGLISVATWFAYALISTGIWRANIVGMLLTSFVLLVICVPTVVHGLRAVVLRDVIIDSEQLSVRYAILPKWRTRIRSVQLSQLTDVKIQTRKTSLSKVRFYSVIVQGSGRSIVVQPYVKSLERASVFAEQLRTALQSKAST